MKRRKPVFGLNYLCKIVKGLVMDVVKLIFGGDAMLGRLTGQAIQRYGAAYPLGQVARTMRSADLTIVNLECAITSAHKHWRGQPKAFYFGAPPAAADSLSGAGVDLVSLANNHMLDFDVVGMRDTLQHLRQHHIRFAGAGEDIDEAVSPAFIERKGIRFGMAAFCNHQSDFAATPDKPGIAWVNLEDKAAALECFGRALEPMRRAAVDWPILSLHWGPNMVRRPAPALRALAHEAIEMGWKILFGHSAHIFQGIEIHRGCPVIYAAGDLVDDYYVDPFFKNDHQLLFELELSRTALHKIWLHPLFISDCQVHPATDASKDFILQTATRLCAEMGTAVHRNDHKAWINCSALPA